MWPAMPQTFPLWPFTENTCQPLLYRVFWFSQLWARWRYVLYRPVRGFHTPNGFRGHRKPGLRQVRPHACSRGEHRAALLLKSSNMWTPHVVEQDPNPTPPDGTTSLPPAVWNSTVLVKCARMLTGAGMWMCSAPPTYPESQWVKNFKFGAPDTSSHRSLPLSHPAPGLHSGRMAREHAHNQKPRLLPPPFLPKTGRGRLALSRGMKEWLLIEGWMDLIPGSGRSPGGGNGNPLQYSCLENSMERGAWRLQSMWSQRVGHNLVTKHTHTLIISTYSLFSLSLFPIFSPFL